MNLIVISFKTAFLLLIVSFLSKANAGNNALSCAAKTNLQVIGAIPEFTSTNIPLQGYQCQHIPFYSGFKGNWFPNLPKLYFSQTTRFLTNAIYSSKSSIDTDYSQDWQVDLSIKRFGRSQLSLFIGNKEWQQTLQANKAVIYFPSYATDSEDGVIIKRHQNYVFRRSEDHLGLSFIFPYQSKQGLTEIRAQHTFITQPVQASIISFEKHSLFLAEARINELLMISQSNHRGLNINWQMAVGIGKVTLKPEETVKLMSEYSEIMSLRGQLEIYYHHRINRLWFGHAGWKSDIHYWQQSADNKEFRLANASTIEQQVFLGLGLTF